MILVDTSAWVEYLRATGSPVHHALRRYLAEGAALATTEVVVMEILAGARHREEHAALRSLLGVCEFAPVEGLADYELAAALYRDCRANGETIRKLTDCLIAVVAMRAGARLMHRDADFAAIARHAPLQLA